MLGQVRSLHLERHLERHGVSSFPIHTARMCSDRKSSKCYLKDTHAATASPVPSTSSCHCEAMEEAPSCNLTASSGPQDSQALLALELGISEDQLAWLSRVRPELLHRPTSRLRKRLHGLAALLGCSVTQAACMTQKQPALLDIAAEWIRQRLALLTAGLGVDRSRACSAARRMPRLLASDEYVERLEQHMQQLQSIFNQSRPADVGAIAATEPQLLVMEPAQIRRRMQGLATCLEVNGDEEIVRVCCSHPWLLTMSASGIDSKIASLASSMQLARSTALRLVRSYPRILQQSEQGVIDKIAVLTKVFPRHQLQLMVCREPSLLTRSCSKILQTFHATQAATSMSTQATLDVAAKRPAVLTRSSQAPERCFRALSIWRLSTQEKQQLIQAHPVLLRLSPKEVHSRCRWMRQLMISNGLYHSTFRRIPLKLLGIILLHLPAAWSRLQYLAESSQECKMELMNCVQSRAKEFDSRFPDYRRWLHYKTSEMGCQLPWRQVERRRYPANQRLAARSSDPEDSSLSASCSGATENGDAPYSWHSAGAAAAGSPAHRPLQQTVIGEADVIYYGLHPVRKPRRVVYTAAPQLDMLPPPPSVPDSADTPATSSDEVEGSQGSHMSPSLLQPC